MHFLDKKARGYPIYREGKLAGGIGVSGGAEEQDQLCCLAALACLPQEQATGKGMMNR